MNHMKSSLRACLRGSLRLKERNGHKYFYLAYRRDGKVVSEYVGNDESVVADLKERLEHFYFAVCYHPRTLN
ncbi:MAG: hypothetical protein ABFD25_04310 [Clostridiaceae bacterium]